MWKKFEDNKPPMNIRKFLVVTSNHIIPIIEIVKKVNCSDTCYYVLENGRIITPESILYWMELPEFNEEFPVDIETIIFNRYDK